ncbi:MAG: hypothetical protein HY926_01255 [Elusimicrobia bacterium]|nr:hypothetical protein [Elusimicrobiota bacterium]
MRRMTSILCLAAALLAACGEETRNGQLTLAGSNPLKLADESGKVVEFLAGPTKVVFSAESSRRFKVSVSQGQDKQATFSGQAPAGSGWNFTLRGKDIGQQVDLASDHKVEFVGRPWRTIRDGGPCGFNGRMVIEEEYQTCNEDWRVDFADSASAQPVGTFRSKRDNLTCLIYSRDLYCRDYGPNPPYPPYPHYPRRLSSAEDSVKKLNDLGVSGIKFD